MGAKQGFIFGLRHVQIVLLFLSITVMYISRLNVAISVVAMTDAASTNPDFHEYDWTEAEKSLIQSAFYWSYICTQFPGGFLSRRFGSMVTISGALCVTAVLSGLTPLCIYWGGWQAYSAIRLLMGLFQGVVFPAIYHHLAMWCPPSERNRLGSFALSGGSFGIVLSFFTTGQIAASSLGWPGISYISAVICFAVCILWWVFGAGDPTKSRWISAAEREYIEGSLKRTEDSHKTKTPVPWKAIFTSVPFCCLVLSFFGHTWGIVMVQSKISTYLHGVLEMNIQNNGLFSALPFLASWALSYVFIFLGDVIIARKWMSLRTLRLTFNTLSSVVPAAGLIGISYMGKANEALALTILTSSMALHGASAIGSDLNSLDLSPNHAGILSSISNTVSSAASLCTPLAVGAIVPDPTNRGQWQIAFYLGAGIFIVCALVYGLWFSVEVQPWDALDYKETRKDKAKNASQDAKAENEKASVGDEPKQDV